MDFYKLGVDQALEVLGFNKLARTPASANAVRVALTESAKGAKMPLPSPAKPPPVPSSGAQSVQKLRGISEPFRPGG